MKTEIFSCNSPDFDDNLVFCAEIIKRGGLVVFPTETVYGLGADATNAEAAGRIYAAKGRPSDNPLIIHIAKPDDAEEYAYTNETYYLLAERFMPGPLTVVLEAKESVPAATRGGLSTVAVRCPSSEIARRLISLSGVPIAAPSANLSGSPSPTSVSHAISDMQGRVDAIIDGGSSDFGLESTIVKIDREGSVVLLRPGAITPDDLCELGVEVRINSAVTEELQAGEVAESPGMKYKHYAPRCSLYLLDGELSAVIAYISEISGKRIGLLCYSEDAAELKANLPDAVLLDFGHKANEVEQAHELFRLLRLADDSALELLFAPLPKKSGVGLALYNRMIRAAAHNIIKL